MREEGRISAFAAMVYQVAIVLATAVFFVPSIMVTKARQDVWLSGFLACLFGFLVVFIATRLALRFPEETVVEYAPRLLGKFGGKLVGFIYTFYFFYGGYYVMRQFGELMATAYYPHTPIIVFIVVLGLLACYVTYLGLEVLCRVILVWGVFAPVFLLLLLLLVKDIQVTRFLPLMEFGIGPVICGTIAPAGWLAQMAVVFMLVPFISDRWRVLRTSLTAVLSVFFLGEVVLVTAIGVMGAETVSRLLFPAFTLFRRVHVASLPVLDRLDAIFMMLWMGGMLLNLSTFFHAGMLGLGQWLGLKSYRPLIFPVGALLTALAIGSWDSVTELVVFSTQTFPLTAIFVNFVVTGFLLLVALGRGKRGELVTGGGQRAPAADKKA
ncbi:GerAB/ArcD/ProY family transporter [Thermodesulfitimonas autotrophica]|uniref:GerAB/ArcD/ProY family transporter n=1 Tax=Thermodesulfitimonas autotrophica TaxID=1894989 RepID=UPI002FE1D21B